MDVLEKILAVLALFVVLFVLVIGFFPQIMNENHDAKMIEMIDDCADGTLFYNSVEKLYVCINTNDEVEFYRKK